MKLFKKKCAYCNIKIEKGNEVFAHVKIPEFIELKKKTFCTKDHYEQFILKNQGTKSRKPYCMNCDD